ncbi:MAG TPA: alpha-L-fucosidase, partial [Opitutus sp.]|nr:alpha-L-fucosidase [Opitutus sp.]
KGIGRWTHKHAEVMGDTTRGIPRDYYGAPSLLSRDRTVLYLVCYDRPADGLWVKGIMNAIRRVSVVGGGDAGYRRFMRADWAGEPGILVIDIPADQVDPDATVLKVELEGALRLKGL